MSNLKNRLTITMTYSELAEYLRNFVYTKEPCSPMILPSDMEIVNIRTGLAYNAPNRRVFIDVVSDEFNHVSDDMVSTFVEVGLRNVPRESS